MGKTAIMGHSSIPSFTERGAYKWNADFCWLRGSGGYKISDFFLTGHTGGRRGVTKFVYKGVQAVGGGDGGGGWLILIIGDDGRGGSKSNGDFCSSGGGGSKKR